MKHAQPYGLTVVALVAATFAVLILLSFALNRLRRPPEPRQPATARPAAMQPRDVRPFDAGPAVTFGRPPELPGTGPE